MCDQHIACATLSQDSTLKEFGSGERRVDGGGLLFGDCHICPSISYDMIFDVI